VNIGSDFDLRLKDIAATIIQQTGSASKIIIEERTQFYSIQQGLPDLTKAREELGWLPVVTFEQGLKRTIEYVVANRGIVTPLQE